MKSLKTHLSRVVGNSKLDFKDMSTVLTQIEACLYSHPLGIIPHNDDDGIEMLSPGRFLISHPFQAFPESVSFQPVLSIL